MLRRVAARERLRFARLAAATSQAFSEGDAPLPSKSTPTALFSTSRGSVNTSAAAAAFQQWPLVRLNIARLATAAAPQQSGSVKEFRLAQTGEGIKECELVQWFVREGDAIEEFSPICEVQSDKATVEITSPFSGLVSALKYKPGDVIQVGEVLADIETIRDEIDEGSSSDTGFSDINSSSSGSGGNNNNTARASNNSSTAFPLPATTALSSPEENSQERLPDRVLTSPAVRRLSRELGIDLTRIIPTGPGGRVTKTDVLAFVDSLAAAPTSTASDEVVKAVPTTETRTIREAHLRQAMPLGVSEAVKAATELLDGGTAITSMITKNTINDEGSIAVPLRGYRRAMVRTMTAAASVPHFHFCDEVSVDALSAVRDRVRAAPSLYGTKLTYMPFFIKAAAMALAEFPAMNSSLSSDGGSLLQHRRINIGIAVATPLGLVVPNIKNAASKSVAEIAVELTRLQANAIANSLSPEDVSGGTFTLSNIGSIGGTYATPLVNPPEAAIMALGKIQRLPRFADSLSPSSNSNSSGGGGDTSMVVVPTRILNVSLGADHRIVDGATLAGFGQMWKALVEDPGLMLLSLK